ncbi:MAG: aminoglycoside phosphotransferase family protein [Sediminimonas sp.]|uniref:aminoglycoside phosphotransferase family protein n=1 Tax=Sediminimonas sp. TaxID=2823379 RepID=UPI0028702730|nr:aminoglycoside phosphotransferase family protein [Sediminimonas sp.]MDR9484676.1 aminoglycoside phosphotransferase family protein [Sediminimonas sp.]
MASDYAHLVRYLEEEGIVPSGASWTRMEGGRTNRLWKLDAGKGTDALVVKLYSHAAPNPMFPNQPEAEERVLRHLVGQGVAPECHALLETPLGPCLIYRYLPGAPWRTDPAPVARQLRRLHQMPAPPDLRHGVDGAAQIIEQTRLILSHVPQKQSREHEQTLPRLALPGPSGQRALLHGDVVPGNLVMASEGPVLIDWQCPAAGDPAEDLAIFLSPAMQQLYCGRPLDKGERAAFLAAYDDPETIARLRALAPWHHWRMAAYCLWRLHQGATDYAEGYALERAALCRYAESAAARDAVL